MQGQVKVDYHELYALHDRLKSIARGFAEVDDKGDFQEAVFGDRRIVDALTKFASGWSDARGKIYDSVNSLADSVWQTAKQYEDVDRELAKAIEPDGGRGGAGGNDSGGNQSGGGGASGRPSIPTAPVAGAGAVAAGFVGAAGGGGAIPPEPTTMGGTGAVPGGLLPPLPRPVHPPVGLPPFGDADAHGARDRARELSTRADRLDVLADDIRQRALALPPGRERDGLLRDAGRLEDEAQALRRLAERDDLQMHCCEPTDGRFVGVLGGDGGRLVVVVGEPGGAGRFTETLANADELAAAMGEDADVRVVVWQDFGCEAGGPASPDQAVDQGASNLRGFVQQAQADGGAPGGVAVVGDGVGADVIDRAMAEPIPGVDAVTPAAIGEQPSIEHGAAAPSAIAAPPDTGAGPELRSVEEVPAPSTGAGEGAAPSHGEPQPAVGNGGMSSNAMFGVMALAGMGQSLFFRGGGVKRAAAKAAGREENAASVTSW